MGTHLYLVEALKIPKETVDYTGLITFEQFSEKHDTTTTVQRFYSTKEVEYVDRFYSAYTCREIMTGYLSTMLYESKKNLIGNKKIKCLLGIRGLGETYTDVAKAIQKEKGSASVSAFLSKLFGIPMNVTYGFSNEKSKAVRFRTDGKLNLYGKNKPVNGHINLMFDMDNLEDIPNIHLLISAVMALLRETRIITGILKGEISTIKTLIKELHSICTDRFTKEDTSYDCWLLMNNSGDNIREAMAQRGNVDGSDYWSMTKLALFITGFCKGLLTKNGLGNGGPVYYISNLAQTDVDMLLEITKKWRLNFDKFLVRWDDEDDDDEDDEDFWDEDEEEDDE